MIPPRLEIMHLITEEMRVLQKVSAYTDLYMRGEKTRKPNAWDLKVILRGYRALVTLRALANEYNRRLESNEEIRQAEATLEKMIADEEKAWKTLFENILTRKI